MSALQARTSFLFTSCPTLTLLYHRASIRFSCFQSFIHQDAFHHTLFRREPIPGRCLCYQLRAFRHLQWRLELLQQVHLFHGRRWNRRLRQVSRRTSEPWSQILRPRSYQSQIAAQNAGLISTTGHSVIFRADNTSKVDYTSAGRPSVRLEGTAQYNRGIFVADIQHMPGTGCGHWPSFWSYGNNWPHDGEIDIVEGVNLMTKNKYSLHSGEGTCTIVDKASADSGTIGATDCHTLEDDDTTVVNTAGCSIDSGVSADFGDGFNTNSGGYYVTQWTSTFIKHWFFKRGSEPASIHCDVPDPSTFGTPDAFFSGCDFASKFSNQHLVFSTQFCGAWAGATGVYDQTTCPTPLGPNFTPDQNCRQNVGQNPSQYTNQ